MTSGAGRRVGTTRRVAGLAVVRTAVLSTVLTAMLGALAVLVPATSATAGEASWSVRPQDASAPVLEHSVRPGDELDDAVVVRNEGTGTLDLRVSSSDTRTDDDGVLEVADTRTGPGAWVSVPVGDGPLVLGAGEQVVVPVRVRVPADATPGTHVAAVVTTVADEQDGVAVERRLALRVVLTVEEAGVGAAWVTAGLVLVVLLVAGAVALRVRSRTFAGKASIT